MYNQLTYFLSTRDGEKLWGKSSSILRRLVLTTAQLVALVGVANILDEMQRVTSGVTTVVVTVIATLTVRKTKAGRVRADKGRFWEGGLFW